MIFFTSDLHLGHRMVAGARKQGSYDDVDRESITLEDVAWHDDMLAENWDRTVGRSDQVWVLGDLSIGDGGFERALQWIRERPGQKHLISGNHDPTAPWRTKAYAWQRKALTSEVMSGPAFQSVSSYAERKIGDRRVALSHFPYGPVVLEPTWSPGECRELLRYPGYVASSEGFIIGRSGRTLKPHVMDSGYHQLTLSLGNKVVVHRYVHQLVAEAFHGVSTNPELEVGHCNGHKWDNRAINVRWVTKTENAWDQHLHGTARGGSVGGQDHWNSKITADDVELIRASTGVTQQELADRFGISRSHAGRIRRGQSWVEKSTADHSSEARFEEYRVPDSGKVLLHGHVHSPDRVNGREIHVGTDAWDFAPVSLERIQAIVADIA